MTQTTYDLKVTLRDIRPMIWRRLRVPSDIRLGDLHAVVQVAFGWEDCHLHQFVVGRAVYGPPDPDGFDRRTQSEDVRLDQVARAKSKLLYEYDFGDSWRSPRLRRLWTSLVSPVDGPVHRRTLVDPGATPMYSRAPIPMIRKTRSVANGLVRIGTPSYST